MTNDDKSNSAHFYLIKTKTINAFLLSDRHKNARMVRRTDRQTGRQEAKLNALIAVIACLRVPAGWLLGWSISGFVWFGCLGLMMI